MVRALIGISLIIATYLQAMHAPPTLERRLERAVLNSDIAMVEKIFAQENPDLTACYGENQENILIRAINGNFSALGVVKILLEKGVDINAIATDGNTPLFQAIFLNQASIALLLLDNNADITRQIKIYGHSPATPLGLAEHFCLDAVVKKILEKQESMKLTLKKEHE